MTLHIYNPEHDIALACNKWKCSLPKAAKLTRQRYWDVPLNWAKAGDLLLVDEITPEVERQTAEKGVKPVTLGTLTSLTERELPEKIEPWGWDRYIVRQLINANKLLKPLCPTDEKLQEIREMSSRKYAAENILPQLVASGPRFIGESKITTDTDDLVGIKNVVLKSPWSCSGRGVRLIKDYTADADFSWAKKTIHEQGYIMQEPLYENLQDFAMEFYAQESGVEYRSLNVFETREGRYVRNQEIQKLQNYGTEDILEKIKTKIVEITTELFKGKYVGPFGVDMMIVKGEGEETNVHPCVEMNLRRTMGNLS